MGQLTPLTLDDGTTIYMEATETNASHLFVPDYPTEPSEPKRGLFPDASAKQIALSFDAIEATIRAYTTYTLSAFKQLAHAEVSEVTLKFGVNVDIQTGLPYIANGKAGCNTEITVKCVFPKKVEP